MSMPKHAHLSKPIDLHAPGAVDHLLAFHRSVFGNLRMEDGAGDGAGSDGAAGDAGAGAGAANGGSGTSGTGDAGNGAQQAATWNPDAWDGKVESLPKAAQKMLNDLRKEDGDERIAKKTLDAIMATLNPEGDPAEKDPVKLAQQLAAKDAESQANAQTAKSTALELAVLKAAIKAGADTDALTDSRSFMSQVAGLDPAASDFDASVTTAVTDAVKNNPKLKAARVAGQSSVDHAGGSGEGDHTLDAQIADAEKAGQHALAIQLKRQKAYGVKQ